MKKYTVRLPEDLHARLEQDARDSHRSLHAEIVYRLEGSYLPEDMVAVSAGWPTDHLNPVTPMPTGAASGKKAAGSLPSSVPTIYESERLRSQPAAGTPRTSKARTGLCAHRIPATAWCSRCD